MAAVNLLNRDTDYAVRALRYMAQHPGETVAVKDLHPELRVPRPYLRGVLQKLARHGLLRSFRGRGGGFRLSRRPAAIRLTEVIAIFQGELDLAHCVLHGRACLNRATCPLRRTVKAIESMAARRLRATTIASLLKS